MSFLAIPSLRWRLVVIMCVAYILVAAVTEVVGYNTQRNNLHHQLETRARTDAFILAAGSLAPLETFYRGGQASLNEFVDSLTDQAGVTYAAVFAGKDGCSVATTFPHRTSATTLPRPTQKTCLKLPYDYSLGATILPNGDAQGHAPIVGANTILGVAMVRVADSSVVNELNDTLKSDLVLRGIGLLIFLILTLAVAQYILGPLSGLARAAYAIRHGQMTTRVPPGGHTELATVAEAFNDMASALEQRIQHLSFLASAAPVLPRVFRDNGDSSPTLREFCVQLDTRGAGLLPREPHDEDGMWYDMVSDESAWHVIAESAATDVTGPTAVMRQGWAVMVVPVLGDTIFVTARPGERSFSREEQQVITNFAYQLGVAADNARLFEAQQEALQVKDQFLSIVSHELRTPLTTIKGYAQMLRRKLENEPDELRFAVNIDAQVSRLSRLVDDLLDVTRFSRGQFELKRHRVDLRPVLEDVIARFRIVAPDHRFELELDDGPFEGLWDRDRLEQIMNNLVGNAVKYSPTGGTVTLATAHEHGELIVKVQDEGIGIAEEDQQYLFERFYRGNAEGGNVKGLGLGLYVTQRIVEAHGGMVGVRSRPGKGSEFYFKLPLAPVPVASGQR